MEPIGLCAEWFIKIVYMLTHFMFANGVGYFVEEGRLDLPETG